MDPEQHPDVEWFARTMWRVFAVVVFVLLLGGAADALGLI